ncbi:hypothetical protein [Mycobacterium lepromatosis]|uniref:hypothetical protein n=1 Tax=Mycobacterium lepromatosis TaxID=480418 RepID=UPI00138E10BA|nr:hypothetical protein [Mycobacterium lepromatosis]
MTSMPARLFPSAGIAVFLWFLTMDKNLWNVWNGSIQVGAVYRRMLARLSGESR